jgi:hypothetical protein
MLIPIPFAVASDWLAPIAGVVGVVIGAVFSTGGSIWVQSKADRRADTREQEARDHERTVTISLLLTSLEALRGYLRSLQRDVAWQAPVGDEWLAIWQDRAQPLAGSVALKEYKTVAAAFLVARLLIWQGSSEGEDLTDEDRSLISNWLEMVEQGMTALNQLGSATPPDGVATR